MKAKIAIVLSVFVLLAAIIVMLPADFCFALDMECWYSWCTHMYRYGFSTVYDSPANYPPFFLYLLYFFGLLQGSEEAIKENINLIKFVPLAFDFLPFIALYYLYKKHYFKNNVHYYLLFNIAYFYNSVAWGQVDSIHSNLTLLAFLVAFKSPVVSVILFTVALNTKMQAIIFLPVLALILVTQLRNFKQVIYISIAIVATEIIITLPFILTGNFHAYLDIYLSSVDKQPRISMNAFNLWHLILWNQNPQDIYDGTTWIIFTFKQYGLVFFLVASFFSLLPLLLKSLLAFIEKKMQTDYFSLLFLTAAMVTLSFFYFNTQMHERYIHPVIIMLFFYAAFSGRYVLYALVSVAYFMEIERVLQFLRLPVFFYDSILDKHFIAILFSVAVVLGFKTLYSSYSVKKDFISLRILFFTMSKSNGLH